MGIFNQTVGLVRDLWANEITAMEFGDDGTEFSVTQTDLISAIASSEISINKSLPSTTIVATGRLTVVVIPDEDIREYSLKRASDGFAHSRDVIPTIRHTANDEVVIIKNFNVRQT